MKGIALCLLAATTALRADIVAQWNFNDTNALAATAPAPSTGSGAAALVGGTTASFAGGSLTDPGSTNNAWNTTTYPAQGTANKTAGVRFAVNTTGYTNLGVSFDTRDSNTGSKYTRLQYSTDGSTFTDFAVITNTTAFASKSNSLVGVLGVDNNPNFVIRIVAEWESTAIGTANNIYTNANAPSGTYGTSGTIRYDMVTVWGTLVGAPNTLPVISALANQTMRVNQSTNQPFTVGDLETPATSLVVTGASSNPTLVPNGNIVITSSDGSGSNRVVTVTAAAGQTGSAIITLTVVDGGTLTAVRSFTLTVLPANTPPTLTGLGTTNTLVSTPVTIAFTIGDMETSASNLALTGTSTYTTILPPGGITFGGAGSNRTVTISPAAGQTGVAVVNVNVSDGSLSTNVTFAVMVVPVPAFIFNEPFTYNDGPLVGPNAGNLWLHHSGAVTGEVAVAGGQVVVDEIYTEDVSAPLIGAPYPSTTAGSLYVKCKLNLTYLPASLDPSTNPGSYLLHLKDDGTINFRARVILGTTNAAAGSFRLGILNSTSTNPPVQFPMDLSPGVNYTVVTRYELGTGLSTLWVNPTVETDPSVTANDPVSLAPVTMVALRQALSIGSSVVDDLIVATTFAAALGNTNPPANTTPSLSAIPAQMTTVGAPTPAVPFTVGDRETPAANLTLSGSSSNPALVPDANIVFGGSGSNRTVTVTPVPGLSGAATITVRVSDGVLTNSTTFPLTVLLSLLLADDFSYANGSLTTNSGFFWTNFSGTSGDLLVSNGKLSMTFQRSEDVAAPLTNAPYAPASGIVLYAGLTVNFSELPTSGYFALFKDSSSANFHGKIFATLSNAAPGSFRMTVGNTTSTLAATNPVFAQDLFLNTNYRVIVRYNTGTGVTTLWINPVAEGEASVTANDFAGPQTITTFALRQGSGIGALTVDDLKVGTTFQAVLGEPPAPRITIGRTGAQSASLSWPSSATGYVLQSATNSVTGPYAPFADQGTVQGNLKVLNVTISSRNVFFRLAR